MEPKPEKPSKPDKPKPDKPSKPSKPDNNKPSNVSKGQQIADEGLKYVGNPYVWGGNDLYNGIDCSGFTSKVHAICEECRECREILRRSEQEERR